MNPDTGPDDDDDDHDSPTFGTRSPRVAYEELEGRTGRRKGRREEEKNRYEQKKKKRGRRREGEGEKKEKKKKEKRRKPVGWALHNTMSTITNTTCPRPLLPRHAFPATGGGEYPPQQRLAIDADG